MSPKKEDLISISLNNSWIMYVKKKTFEVHIKIQFVEKNERKKYSTSFFDERKNWTLVRVFTT